MIDTKKRIAGCIAALPIMLAVGCDSTNAAFRQPQPAVWYLPFGDSTTAGPSTRDYTEFLSEKLNTSADRVANEGRGGETTEEGLIRLDELLRFDLFPNAKVFIYWEGGNDINDFIGSVDPFLLFSPDDQDYPYPSRLSEALTNITENIKRAIETANDAGMDAYVVTYFPLATNLGECPALPFDIIFPGQAFNANIYIRRLNDAIRNAASETNATVIDVAAIGNDLVADPANFFNCNHMSAVGNEIVAELIADELVASGRGPDAFVPN